MENSRPREMVSRSPWLLLLCLAATATGVLQAHAQPDTTGFISIDCGLPETASYVDDATQLPYVSDADFIDAAAGSNQNISSGHVTAGLARQYLNLRSFPDGARNCYTLRSLEAGRKYLLRATFMYGNYDGLGRPPVFDIYVGVHFWATVNVTAPDVPAYVEVVAVVPDEFVQVCLVNTGAGTPYISGLDLRPLKSTLYPQANATQGLVLLARINVGPAAGTEIIRYPDDPHDREWIPYIDPVWTKISTNETVRNLADDSFEAPSKVMQTAATPVNASSNIEFSWDAEPQPNKDPSSSPSYVAILHFSELQQLPRNAVRQFYINMNGKLWYAKGMAPDHLYSDAIYNDIPLRDSAQYNVSINATANSTLPPIINAVEVFTIISTTSVGTDAQDVSAVTAIKAKYHVKKNWMGDPCSPKTFAWDGLSCSYALSSPPRITAVNLSYSGLSGEISTSFGSLKAIQSLDLSHNNLTGSIPDTLSQLSSLTFLDLTGNQLNGSIPSGLLKRIQHGSLTLKYGNNPNLCTDADSCNTTTGRSKLAIYIAIPVVLVVVTVLVLVLLCFISRQRRKRGPTNSFVKPLNETAVSRASTTRGGVAVDAPPPSSVQLENRRFTYKELAVITNNFNHVLGRGGFGEVYDGFLEDGTQVAVKLRSDSSNQGVKEFLAEAQILTRIHHKHLVSMIGYCKDGESMALVYEYMSQGTLQEHIAGNGHNGSFLTWRQRLKIALESAQGLEYLHNGCNPPLIHRDVKATNILLNSKLEAKIADFGLSKAFNRDNDTHVSTNAIVGTPGYVDPEYHATMQPTTKSDVYSFGVVLLELIAGRPAILRDPEPTSIVRWAQQRLARGDIEGIVDPRMRGGYDVNGAWKAADVALKCTAMASAQRPAMTDVVAQLQECLELGVDGRATSVNGGGFYTGGGSSSGNQQYSSYTVDGQSTDASQSSTAFEVDRNFGRVPTMPAGPAAR